MGNTGIILAGGNSSRMGKDKGFCTLGNKPMIEWAIDVMRSCCQNIIIGSNSDAYGKFGFPLISDEYKNIGPIGGLHACLKASTTDINFVLSCDMPFVSTELANYLIEQSMGFDAVIPVHDGFFEPLCAVYKKSNINFFEKAIAEKKYKLQDAIGGAEVNYIKIDESQQFFSNELFLNINSPGDLKKFELKEARK